MPYFRLEIDLFIHSLFKGKKSEDVSYSKDD